MPKYRIDNRPTPVAFEGGGLIDKTLQRAKNLLMTQMGEVPYDRYRGFNPALYELPVQQLEEAILPELDRVMLWEPDVAVESAKCFLDEESRVVIEAIIDIDIKE